VLQETVATREGILSSGECYERVLLMSSDEIVDGVFVHIFASQDLR
jgi:hypothetical protein